MTLEERDRKRRIERQKRHKKIMRIRRIIKTVIYLVLALIVFLIIWFGIRPAAAKLMNRNKSSETAQETSTNSDDPYAASKKTLQDPTVGNVGWNTDSRGWWYKNEDATQYVDGWQDIAGQRYYFTQEGYLATGWQSIAGQDVYFDESGVVDEDAHLKLVALTYDDGPSVNTDRILDVLEANGAKATFFVVGQEAENFTEELQREYDLGMEIGNHTYDHTDLWGSDAETIENVLSKNEATIQSLIGHKMEIIRPTGGGVDDTVLATVNQPMILWDVDTLDWDTKDPQNTFNVVKSNVKDGSIILMHDLYEATAEASELIVPWLKEQGYKMVTISELADKYGYSLDPKYRYYDFYPDHQAMILDPSGNNINEQYINGESQNSDSGSSGNDSAGDDGSGDDGSSDDSGGEDYSDDGGDSSGEDYSDDSGDSGSDDYSDDSENTDGEEE